MKHFIFSDPEFAQLTKTVGQDIIMGRKQSVWQLKASYHFPLPDMIYTGIIHFLNSDLELTQLAFVKFMTGYKQSLCEVRTAIVFYKKNKD